MINSIEWSAVLFIRQLEGDLDNPKSLKFEGLDVFLMDIGDHGSTKFQYGPDLVDAYDQNEQLMEEGVRTALVHSHHNMTTFFSGTDKEELEDNTPEDVDMYLSLVVNNKMSWDCKISMYGTQKVVSKGWFKKLGSKITHTIGREVEEKVLYIIDVAVFLEGLDMVAARVEQIKEQKKAEEEARAAERRVNQPPLQLGQGSYNGYQSNFDRDMDWRQPPADLNKSKTTGKDIPDAYAKLLMLSRTFHGSFEDALDFIEKNYQDGTHMAYFLNFFRTRYFVILDELRTIEFLSTKEDPEYDYDTTMGLLDEIIEWKGRKSPIFKAIVEELEGFCAQMEGEEEEEDEDDPKEIELTDREQEYVDQIKGKRK